eukprot:3933782-Rhodomonas_salina.2
MAEDDFMIGVLPDKASSIQVGGGATASELQLRPPRTGCRSEDCGTITTRKKEEMQCNGRHVKQKG